jgi:hypothetical protein
VGLFCDCFSSGNCTSGKEDSFGIQVNNIRNIYFLSVCVLFCYWYYKSVLLFIPCGLYIN